METLTEHLGVIVLATGALGTAAFGIVETLKTSKYIGEAGFQKIRDGLGRQIWESLAGAYGKDFEVLLRAQYRGDRNELAAVLRRGVRIGLSPENAVPIARFLGWSDPDSLTRAAKEAAKPLDDEEKMDDDAHRALGRFELAIDARIDAAMAVAKSEYVARARIVASVFAVALALVAGIALAFESDRAIRWDDYGLFFGAVVVGLAAIPLAPIAKDVASALQSASVALRRRR